jgi:hypothetical protein
VFNWSEEENVATESDALQGLSVFSVCQSIFPENLVSALLLAKEKLHLSILRFHVSAPLLTGEK